MVGKGSESQGKGPHEQRKVLFRTKWDLSRVARAPGSCGSAEQEGCGCSLLRLMR